MWVYSGSITPLPTPLPPETAEWAGMVKVKVRTFLAPLGGGELAAPTAAGIPLLTPNQHRQAQELLQWWVGVCAAYLEGFGCTSPPVMLPLPGRGITL